MLRPSDSSTKRMARLVMRTHAVPTVASTKGSATSAAAISAMPIHRACGCFLRESMSMSTGAGLRPVADPLAQQPLRPEDEHHDQHDERVDVLVVAAEEARLGARRADVREAGQIIVQHADVGEVAHVARAER